MCQVSIEEDHLNLPGVGCGEVVRGASQKWWQGRRDRKVRIRLVGVRTGEHSLPLPLLLRASPSFRTC